MKLQQQANYLDLRSDDKRRIKLDGNGETRREKYGRRKEGSASARQTHTCPNNKYSCSSNNNNNSNVCKSTQNMASSASTMGPRAGHTLRDFAFGSLRLGLKY